MNEELILNKIENEDSSYNNQDDDFDILITKLKEIGLIISSLEKNIEIN